MRTLVVRSYSELLAFQAGLEPGHNYCFRGQASMKWGLVPSLYRPLVGTFKPVSPADTERIAEHERDLYREFNRLARPHVRSTNAWEELCVAQHYGCPTRLLDWSRSLLVAAYFATMTPAPDGAGPAVWCLDLTAMPFPASFGRQVTRGAFRIANLEAYAQSINPSFLQPVTQPLELIARQLAAPPKSTLAVFEVPSISPRVENQAGVFSVFLSFADHDFALDHVSLIESLETESGGDLLIKLEIPYECSEDLRMDLERADMTLFRLFPDLTGLGMHLRAMSDRSLRNNFMRFREQPSA